MNIILDPGHGMSNRKSGRYDPGACAEGVEEADVALRWANVLRDKLRKAGHAVVRTRASKDDPAPVGKRASIASQYNGEIMVSIHCNSADGKANGTETFYRGTSNKAMAERINAALVEFLGTKNRGAKTEDQSQHGRLAVMAFQPTFLIELGFIDHAGDRQKICDPAIINDACDALIGVITGS